jgi:hypothetical protein
MKNFYVAQVYGGHGGILVSESISFLHRLTIKRYFLFLFACGVIIKNTVPESLMPRPLTQTTTDLNAANLLRLPAEFGCPVWVYDAQIIRDQIARLAQFDVIRFAQKACSNIHILRLMREQG